MDKQLYIALENWESYNESINDVSEAIQALSTKEFAAATLIQELARLVEERFTVWRQVEKFGFTNIWQAREALWREKERLAQTAAVNHAI